MDLDYRCGHCGRVYPVAYALVGRKVRCTACGRVDRVPEPEAGPGGIGSYDLGAAPIATPPPPIPAPVVPGPDRMATKPQKSPRERAWFASFREPSPVQEGGLALIALAAADLFVTYALLRRGGGFFESNPVAQWFFARWNMAGMTLFKFAAMGG